MANKKYYWLKLQESFFTDKKVKRLRRISNGDTYTVIYLKMLLLSLKDEGHIYFDEIEEDFIEELALELDEDDEDVAATVKYLSDKHMLEKVDEHDYYLTELNGMVGSETAAAQRVRRYRAKKKSDNATDNTLQCNNDVMECNKNVTESKSKELEKELELEKEIEKEKEENLPVIIHHKTEQLAVKYGLEYMQKMQIYSILIQADRGVDYLDEKIALMEKRCKSIKDDYPYFLEMLKGNWKDKDKETSKIMGFRSRAEYELQQA